MEYEKNDKEKTSLAPLADALADGGDDVIYAGAGRDQVWGGIGNDVIFGEDGDDIRESRRWRHGEWNLRVANDATWRETA